MPIRNGVGNAKFQGEEDCVQADMRGAGKDVQWQNRVTFGITHSHNVETALKHQCRIWVASG